MQSGHVETTPHEKRDLKTRSGWRKVECDKKTPSWSYTGMKMKNMQI